VKLPTFVIQEHEGLGSVWHHDLRLERDGVWKSWAVSGGVPEESGIQRVTHPSPDSALSYGTFEGKIPNGYGGPGQVRIWDRGTYETKSWSDTEIEVTFHGTRLSGDYILRWIERMNNWILWKRRC